MSKIGFFGGSFNPPTIAHFEIVKNALKNFELDKVIVIPMGDKYKKKDLILFKHRFNMLKTMFKNYSNVEISNMQENQKEISYAIDCFRKIDNIYKNDERFFIMGLDNYSQIKTWKNRRKTYFKQKIYCF